jgi:ethanolamine ammonia-lyase small subunit
MSAIVPAMIAARLRALTSARVGLGRTGVSQQTRDLLAFQAAHAQARDAVYARLDAAAMAAAIREITGSEALRLHSAAVDRVTYLQRPDFGRMLDDPSREALTVFVADHHEPRDLAIVVADGLSALAVERHAAALIKALSQRIADWNIALVCVVEQGRVGIGDEIGELLSAECCLVLIGERPGLSSPDSLGAYITWQPRMGRTDADRNCVSNIRGEGLGYEQGAAQIAYYLTEARRRQLTGVALKDGGRRLGEG